MRSIFAAPIVPKGPTLSAFRRGGSGAPSKLQPLFVCVRSVNIRGWLSRSPRLLPTRLASRETTRPASSLFRRRFDPPGH